MREELRRPILLSILAAVLLGFALWGDPAGCIGPSALKQAPIFQEISERNADKRKSSDDGLTGPGPVNINPFR